jgi:hypothetical protein
VIRPSSAAVKMKCQGNYVEVRISEKRSRISIVARGSSGSRSW